jgi:hypothetical protein
MPPHPTSSRPLLTILGSLALTASAPALDLNPDGLPDVWQQVYGAQALTPTIDTDKDGATNEEEAQAGTNPFDSKSRPQLDLLSIGPDADPTVFTFPTTAGTSYQLTESTAPPLSLRWVLPSLAAAQTRHSVSAQVPSPL